MLVHSNVVVLGTHCLQESCSVSKPSCLFRVYFSSGNLKWVEETLWQKSCLADSVSIDGISFPACRLQSLLQKSSLFWLRSDRDRRLVCSFFSSQSWSRLASSFVKSQKQLLELRDFSSFPIFTRFLRQLGCHIFAARTAIKWSGWSQWVAGQGPCKFAELPVM